MIDYYWATRMEQHLLLESMIDSDQQVLDNNQTIKNNL